MAGIVARNYARAFFEIAAEDPKVADAKGGLEEIGAELSMACEALSASAQTRLFLDSRLIGRKAKKELIRRAFTDKAEGRVLNLLYLLVDRGRTSLLVEITEEYGKLLHRARGFREVTVWSAFPLADEQTERIIKALERSLGGRVLVEVKVKPSLIGGVVAESEGREIQFSAEGQIEALEARLAARK
jgi:F-type H+-transporting ATPase subunit delta